MPTSLKFLLIEDNLADSALILEALAQAGFAPDCLRVETLDAARLALAAGPWQAVIAEHHLPGFTYTAALAELRSLRLDIPFIIVAAGMDEDVVTRAMRLGAHDFICKDRLGRLAPALRRELRQAAARVVLEAAPAGAAETLPAASLRSLEATHNRLAMAVDQAAEAIFVIDLDSQLIYINPAFAATTGHDAADALGQPLAKLLPELSLPAPAEGLPWRGRTWTRNGAGDAVHLDGTITPVRDPQGAVTAFVGVLRDVTQELETERNLRHMEKMDALGALASGVAHDFNNILTAILSATELVEWQVTPDSPIMPKLHVIYQAVMRARELNRQILSFSRGSEDKHLPFDLSAVVKEAIFLLRNTFPATVAVSTEISSSLWIMGDPNQVHQVVMNLAINALQSMLPAGGTLDLDLVERDLNGSDLPPGLGEGRYAVLSVKDTGCGMDPATLERIFEPFFTTKGVGDGTGLGLSVVHGIVHKHRGTMAVRSEVGRGSAFEVFFPCTAREMTAVEEQPKEDFSGSERILLVDDEEVLGALGKQGLQMLGYRVTVRSDSQEALDEFLRGPQEFDLLITDLSMPGFSGVELTQRIRKARPDLPAILVTGAFQAPPSMEGITLPFDDVLFKPVTIQDMAKSVRKVLSLRPVAKHAADPASPAAEPAATGTFSILLAEDSSVTRALLSSWMVKAGYRVKVARDGQEAWEHYRKAKESGGFSLVLTDIVMPRMDGLELAAKIRQEDPSVPIVILSSSEDTESVKAALHLKVNEFLTKPFESAVLLACLERMSADQASRLKGQRSVETAQAVRMAQRAMEAVPEKDMPIFSISEPLTDAGGDVFRCHRRADGSIFFAIADVAGHSVISSYAVAAYLGMLSNFVGECVHLCPPPAKNARGGMAQHTCSHFGTMRCEPLKHLAQKLNRTIQTGPFSEVPICSLFGLWQPATGRLHLLNAGVPHALWFRRGPTRTAPIVINGTPLGILDEPPMEEKVIFMEPGDRLLLGSDGFFDAASADHAVFEAAAGSIWRDLACTDILTAINLVSEAARVHADGRFADDLLVVALEQPEFPDSPDRFHRTFASAAGEIDHTCDDLSAFLCSHLPASEQAGAQCFDALIAVREALSNAMLHGNAGAADARISVRSHWEGQGRLQVAVTDEGLGFDLDSHEPPDTRHSERGRGVPLIRHFARKVTMTGGELNMTFDFGTPAGDPRA